MMMDSSFAFEALMKVALECSRHRDKRTCRNQFGCSQCHGCYTYIGKYAYNVNPLELELFMIEADARYGRMKAWMDAPASVFRGAVIVIIAAIIAWCVYAYIAYEPYRNGNNRPVINTASVRGNEVFDPTKIQTAVTQRMVDVEDTLHKTAVDFNRGVDMNNDRKVNCMDASFLFYKHFPDKSRVRLIQTHNMRNGNDFSHMFISVRQPNGVWVGVEPQAYVYGVRAYDMQSRWGSTYDRRNNSCVTAEYSARSYLQ